MPGMKGKHARVAISECQKRIIRDPGAPEELITLARSYLARPVHPIVLRLHDMAVLDGNRRLLGLESIGETHVDAYLTEEELSDIDLVHIGLITAVHRKGMSDFEQYQGVSVIESAHKDWNRTQLADFLNIPLPSLTTLLSLSGCIPEVKQLAAEGRFSRKEWYAISQLRPDEQPALVQIKLSGKGGHELAAAAKKMRKPSSPLVTASRFRIPLPDERIVTITGGEQSLDEVAETLAQALKAVKAAISKNFNAKTAQAVFKDLAAV
jgi:ParB-like chromosome segregation protein Spo0J